MAQLAILSGRISESHEKNLKMYAFVFFNGVNSAKIDYNLDRSSDDKKYVTYHLEIHPDFFNNKLKKRFEAIQSATRTLFWSDLEVNVYLNGKKLEWSENE
jgi:hypothetical protein